jgi:hypothetical protein
MELHQQRNDNSCIDTLSGRHLLDVCPDTRSYPQTGTRCLAELAGIDAPGPHEYAPRPPGDVLYESEDSDIGVAAQELSLYQKSRVISDRHCDMPPRLIQPIFSDRVLLALVPYREGRRLIQSQNTLSGARC